MTELQKNNKNEGENCVENFPFIARDRYIGIGWREKKRERRKYIKKTGIDFREEKANLCANP